MCLDRPSGLDVKGAPRSSREGAGGSRARSRGGAGGRASMVVMVVAGLADATNILFQRGERLLSAGEIPSAQSALEGLEICGGLIVLAGGSVAV